MIQPAEDGRALLDPATGEVAVRAPKHTVADLETAVAAADAIEANAEALAELLSREQGKPLNGPNARFEVGSCAAWLRATVTR